MGNAERVECRNEIFSTDKYLDFHYPSWWTIPLLGGIMQQVNLFQFYRFGQILHPLTMLESGKALREYYPTIAVARMFLESFLGGEMLPMPICRQSAQKAIEAINVLLPRDPNAWDNIDMDREAEWGDLYFIMEAVKTFETVFSAELHNLPTYFVSQKGIFETNNLIQKADEYFAESIRAKFTEQVRTDLKEAGKCLAFDLATASGFHIARAVEGVLVEYLKCLCPEKLDDKKDSQRNLGKYIKLAKEENGDEKVCGALDQFRDLHRNPLVHPETVLSIEEALTLHGIAQSAIVAMILDMEKRNNPTLALPL